MACVSSPHVENGRCLHSLLVVSHDDRQENVLGRTPCDTLQSHALWAAPSLPTAAAPHSSPAAAVIPARPGHGQGPPNPTPRAPSSHPTTARGCLRRRRTFPVVHNRQHLAKIPRWPCQGPCRGLREIARCTKYSDLTTAYILYLHRRRTFTLVHNRQHLTRMEVRERPRAMPSMMPRAMPRLQRNCKVHEYSLCRRAESNGLDPPWRPTRPSETPRHVEEDAHLPHDVGEPMLM